MSAITTDSTRVRPKQAAELLGVGVSTLWRYTKNDPDFPRPRKVNARISFFLKEELDAWLDSRTRIATAQSH